MEDFEWGISTVTLGELRLGVLQARDPVAASRRLSTYQLAQRFEARQVDSAVLGSWALLVSKLRAAGRKAPVNDSWIAATAITHRIPVVTQDNDYDDMPDLQVIKSGWAGTRFREQPGDVVAPGATTHLGSLR
ncbi:MAG TPA: PIN domain-containing protein [Streptosporangiaceae bacterium]